MPSRAPLPSYRRKPVARAGARRGGVSVSRRSRTHPNRHSRAAGSPTPCASRHTDTVVLPPLRCLRYLLPMEVAISHRNQNSTSPHAVGAASLSLGGLVRIDGRRGLKGVVSLRQIRLFLPRATASKRIKSTEAGECSAGGVAGHICNGPNGTGGNTHRRSRGGGNPEWRTLPFALSLSKPVLRLSKGLY